MSRALLALLALALLGCSGAEPAPEQPTGAPPPRAEEAGGAPARGAAREPDEEPEARAPTCAERHTAAEARVEELAAEHRACTFDTECVPVELDSPCWRRCSVAVHPRGVEALRARVAEVAGALCAEAEEAGCEPSLTQCARSTPRCAEGACAMDDGDPPVREVPVPEESSRRRADAPPPRPPAGDAEERARRLLRAVALDDPAIAQDFFFPRAAFRRVKAIADPDAYWSRLFARYARDVHALHERLGDLEGATFVRLELVRRGGWVRPGEEANALPYWVSRHSRLHYRVGGRERSFEVRVLITWGTRWYITHLSEFH